MPRKSKKRARADTAGNATTPIPVGSSTTTPVTPPLAPIFAYSEEAPNAASSPSSEDIDYTKEIIIRGVMYVRSKGKTVKELRAAVTSMVWKDGRGYKIVGAPDAKKYPGKGGADKLKEYYYCCQCLDRRRSKTYEPIC